MGLKVKITSEILERLKSGEQLELNINGEVFREMQKYMLNIGYELYTNSAGLKKTVSAKKIEQ